MLIVCQVYDFVHIRINHSFENDKKKERKEPIHLNLNPYFSTGTSLVLQWNLRIKDTLGAEVLSSFWRLSSGGRFEPIGHL